MKAMAPRLRAAGRTTTARVEDALTPRQSIVAHCAVGLGKRPHTLQDLLVREQPDSISPFLLHLLEDFWRDDGLKAVRLHNPLITRQETFVASHLGAESPKHGAAGVLRVAKNSMYCDVVPRTRDQDGRGCGR